MKPSFIVLALFGLVCPSAMAHPQENHVKENIYKGELAAYPGAWAFHIGRAHIILVSDQELEALSDPDKVLNLTLTFDKYEASLRQICERAKAAGQRTLIIAYDHFFSQYRPGQAGPRQYTPDMDAYVERIARIAKFAEGYGLGLELSLLSPLEIGPAYARATGESGKWMHYRKGLRNPRTGAYSVQMWRQLEWANNKGVIEPKPIGVRVFAFREQSVPGTLYRVVDPAGIVDISQTAQVEVLGEPTGRPKMQRIRVHGTGEAAAAGLDRVLVVQIYETPELDYFSPKALPFMTSLVDKYVDAGVKLNALYSDEMHIQQDWGYFNHHDHGEFAVRYVSDGLAKRYAELHGAEFADFAKYLLYFTTGQDDFATDLTAKAPVQHVFGASPEQIRRTALFRARYYRLLQDGVVDLFVAAKRHAEKRFGHLLEARAHATWAQSPTIDYWRTGRQPMFRSAYEYTSNFVWSNTVHQAASACYDYFKWGDFLTGNGTDHPEGGWIDRSYYALALASSIGILNDVPNAYCAHWGMPDEISHRRQNLVNAYGASASPLWGMVQDMEHRDVEVLMLYPLDLVAVEERFGSWMTQYGYTNYVTAAKLLERGRVRGGAIEMAGRRFTTLCTLFEPFPSSRLLERMEQFVEQGGRLIWSGPPPVLSLEGQPILERWQRLLGVSYTPGAEEGMMAPGQVVEFEGALQTVPPQTILTDFLVDRIYPVTPAEGTQVAARSKGAVVGTVRRLASGGLAAFLGFRPRDDQSRSLGYETRTWFEALSALGAYPGEDNTERLSRTTEYLACRFPNGTVSIARHFREMEEGWPGGFARNREQDAEYIRRNPPPTQEIRLENWRVAGHTVSFQGEGGMAFRLNKQGDLIAFAGSACKELTVNGRTWVFSDAPVPQFAWAPVQENRRVPGGAVLQIMVYGNANLRIPAIGLPARVRLFAEGPRPGSRGVEVPCKLENGSLIFTTDAQSSGRWLWLVEG